MGIHNNALIGASSQGYKISRSVRTRSSASAYFNRTFSTPTLGTKWTWSAWVKRGTLGAAQTLFSGQVDVNNWGIIAFLSGDTLTFQQADAASVTSTVTTTQVFRDSSAWYHIIVVFDSTQATAANRLKMYVNGVQITAFGTATYLAQNTASRINAAVAHQLSRYISAAQYFDGYMTEVNFIDGQALTPSSFGETNAVTGVWQPKRYAGTYGTNGFYLDFSDNSGVTATTIGKDYSGNGNNWTPNNISITAGATYDSMIDVPTLYADGDNGRGNYAVMNAVDNTLTLSNANLYAQETVADTYGASRATIAIPTSGKWYWEHKIANAPTGSSITVGLATSTAVLGGVLTGATTTASYNTRYATSRTIANGATLVRNDAAIAFTTNDIVQCAYDAATGKLWFGKNNAWFDTATGTTGNPSAGTNQIITVTLTGPLFPFISSFHEVGSGGAATYVNFGQQPFTYTPPTGFVALNTQNLPTPTISNGAQYMAATLYAANGSTQTISNAVNGVSMQPDFVWVKSRQYTTVGHSLFDALRPIGVNSSLPRLVSNSTDAETNNGGLTAFVSNGFSLNNDAYINSTSTGGNMVAWQWNAGGSTVTNTSGSISAQVRANPTAGFSVVTYTGTGANATVGHGLGVAPKMMILKNRSSAVGWRIYHASLANAATTLAFDTAAADGTNATTFNSTAPTSIVFSLGTSNVVNGNGNLQVAYCFAAVAGYSAFGSYTGNGSTDGPFVYLGFRPRFLLVKAYSSGSAERWLIWDSSRDTYNIVSLDLVPNTTATEGGALAALDFLSNGFKIRTANSSAYNFNGYSYIYAAFAENPFKNSLAR